MNHCCHRVEATARANLVKMGLCAHICRKDLRILQGRSVIQSPGCRAPRPRLLRNILLLPHPITHPKSFIIKAEDMRTSAPLTLGSIFLLRPHIWYLAQEKVHSLHSLLKGQTVFAQLRHDQFLLLIVTPLLRRYHQARTFSGRLILCVAVRRRPGYWKS